MRGTILAPTILVYRRLRTQDLKGAKALLEELA
jgi:hypothetical protein